MATLALAAAGAAIGGALLPAGVTLLGATLSGAAIGSQIGALAGGVIDQALFAASGQTRQAPGGRLSDLHVTVSGEGGHVPRLYGRAQFGGQVVWATDFEEEVVDVDAGSGGKGRSGSVGASGAQYRYFANFAVALCEGPVTGIGRIWADGKELSLDTVTWRFYRGAEDQTVDALIVAKEGADNAPAYRGLAYVVFERLDLTPFGNRLPQLSFEVVRAVDAFESRIRSVTLIPGAGEFAYEPTPVQRDIGLGVAATENVHTRLGGTDWNVALDQLKDTLPNVARVSLFVSWFGTDLRAGQCQLRPVVDSCDKETSPLTWSVAGLTRATAAVVSTHEDRPAYGGTPSDASVVAAIADLKFRGLAVTLSPFPLMDIPAGNTLADPHSDGHQPAYPWRGRISVDPASGRPGTVDKTATAAAQIAAFVGTVTPAQFAIDGSTVVYTGPDEWSYRRMILHNASVALAAGGVDTFVIGSELRGLTTVRSGASAYPFVTALVALAADVKSMLGPATKVTYAADWSEYFGHHPDDGSGDVRFHLDPLWSSGSIDAVGIDVYWPLSDWRKDAVHLDQALASFPHDIGYLKSNVYGGEGYDWYYASDADRGAQVRTPITDGLGKPWTFRYKDIVSWWSNRHVDRTGGVEAASPTAWVPRSKPIWFMEVGCPAIDLGSNQPNVFVDPKSAESALPYFSSGARDDEIQRRYLQALHATFDPEDPGFDTAANPPSDLYDGRMVPRDRITVYTWDARPYPAFPAASSVWGDAANWSFGHWLSGRMGGAPVGPTIAAILHDHGFETFDVSAVQGTIAGYSIDRIQSARDTLQPLELSQFIDTFESGSIIRFVSRGASTSVADLDSADLVESRPEAPLVSLTRQQETELPASARINYVAADADYLQAVVEARRGTVASERVATADLAIVIDQAQARAIAETWLYETWHARERASFTLPPSALALEPSDLVRLHGRGREQLLRLTEVTDGAGRQVTALGVDPPLYERMPAPARVAPYDVPPTFGVPETTFLDLPLWRTDATEHEGFVASFQSPWPGGVAVYRSPEETGFTLAARVCRAAVTGRTLTVLPAHPSGRRDNANAVTLRLLAGNLASVTAAQLFDGRNLAALSRIDGSWEIVQFLAADLLAPLTYRLSGLLRGQLGSDGGPVQSIAVGAKFILLDPAVTPLGLAREDLGRPLKWRFGPAIHDIGSRSFATQVHAFSGCGLLPLSPVHIRGRRSSAGDLELSWTRRTRVGGDSWEVADAPLGEESERYEIDVIDPADGARVVRTISASVPVATYGLIDQIADFGVPQSSVPLRLYQMSALVGRGAAASAIV